MFNNFFGTASNPIHIEGNIELGDVTVDAVPSFENSVGSPSRGLIDSEKRVLTNLSSDSIGLIGKIEDVISASASDTELILTGIDSKDRISGFQSNPISVSATTGSAVKMPNIGTARKVMIYSDEDVNFGGENVTTGEDNLFIPGGAPFIGFSFLSAEPDIYFRGRSTAANVTIWPAIE